MYNIRTPESIFTRVVAGTTVAAAVSFGAYAVTKSLNRDAACIYPTAGQTSPFHKLQANQGLFDVAAEVPITGGNPDLRALVEAIKKHPQNIGKDLGNLKIGETVYTPFSCREK